MKDRTTAVFLVQHVRETSSSTEDTKAIGVYSSREKAEDAIRRLSEKPGFREFASGFSIDEYPLDSTYWEDGFVV